MTYHFSQRSIDSPCEAQLSTKDFQPKRLSVLLANRTASMLHDAALSSLFHSYRVELFQNPLDLFLGKASAISYALLCPTAGSSLLAAEAHIIRKQWPSARIVVLGSAPHDLEDQLYDDTVPPDCSAAMLVIAFESRSMDVWQRTRGWHDRKANAPFFPEESDPTKAEPSDLPRPPIPEPRDLPSDEKQDVRQRARSRPFVFAQALLT